MKSFPPYRLTHPKVQGKGYLVAGGFVCEGENRPTKWTYLKMHKKVKGKGEVKLKLGF